MILSAQSIGQRIKQLRRQKSWTQEVVASFIGCTASHISNVENGGAELRPSEIEKRAAEFGVNPLFLIAGIPNDVSEVVDMVAGMEEPKELRQSNLYARGLKHPVFSADASANRTGYFGKPTKRGLALRLFRLNLDMMEITKNWPADAVNT
jgi:transcriptional regulator with XRE-family HTH domain